MLSKTKIILDALYDDVDELMESNTITLKEWKELTKKLIEFHTIANEIDKSRLGKK